MPDISPAPRAKLLDLGRAKIRYKYSSLRTEDSYLHWIKRLVVFHGKRHPRAMGAGEVEAFLSDLAHKVAASTQKLPL